VAKKEVETREVVNRIKNADGSITEIKVTEKRLKKQHDSMMKHMMQEKARREAAAAAPATPEPVPVVSEDRDSDRDPDSAE
jgi:membrane peptidoglycan carboxypeptidase